MHRGSPRRQEVLPQLEAMLDPKILDLVIVLLDRPESLPQGLRDGDLVHCHHFLKQGVVGHGEDSGDDWNIDPGATARGQKPHVRLDVVHALGHDEVRPGVDLVLQQPHVLIHRLLYPALPFVLAGLGLG